MAISRFALATPESLALNPRATRDVAISRDGSRIVYATPRGLALRPIDQVSARPIEGSETSSEVANPFLSPDGESAVPFDAARPELVGAGVEVVQDAGSSEFDVASNGTLVYVSGGTSGSSTMVWVDRQGRDRQLEAPPKWYLYPRLSPDRTRVAVNIAGTDRDVWIWDIQSKSLERLTRDPADDATLIWTRDGREILFGSARFRGVPNIFIQPADGSEDARRVLESSQTQQPIRFAPDGRLIFSQEIPGRSRDILALTLDGTRAVQSLVHTTGADAT